MAFGETTYGPGGASQSQATWEPPAIRRAPAPPPSQGGGGSPGLPSLKDMLKLQRESQEQQLAMELERRKALANLARRAAAGGGGVGGGGLAPTAGALGGGFAPAPSRFGLGSSALGGAPSSGGLGGGGLGRAPRRTGTKINDFYNPDEFRIFGGGL
jgi:hypothetical protein